MARGRRHSTAQVCFRARTRTQHPAGSCSCCHTAWLCVASTPHINRACCRCAGDGRNWRAARAVRDRRAATRARSRQLQPAQLGQASSRRRHQVRPLFSFAFLGCRLANTRALGAGVLGGALACHLLSRFKRYVHGGECARGPIMHPPRGQHLVLVSDAGRAGPCVRWMLLVRLRLCRGRGAMLHGHEHLCPLLCKPTPRDSTRLQPPNRELTVSVSPGCSVCPWVLLYI